MIFIQYSTWYSMVWYNSTVYKESMINLMMDISIKCLYCYFDNQCTKFIIIVFFSNSCFSK